MRCGAVRWWCIPLPSVPATQAIPSIIETPNTHNAIASSTSMLGIRRIPTSPHALCIAILEFSPFAPCIRPQTLLFGPAGVRMIFGTCVFVLSTAESVDH